MGPRPEGSFNTGGCAKPERARLTAVSGAPGAGEWPLALGVNRIGRAFENEVVIDHPTLSARHCEVVVTDLSVRVRDLGSTNGTWLEDRRLEEGALAGGQDFRVGDVTLRLQFEPARVAIPVIRPPEARYGTQLPDGREACYHHPQAAASLQCEKCGRLYCRDCVRDLHRVGGQSHHFCPDCDGLCRVFVPESVRPRRSLLERLRDPILRLLGRRPE